MFICIHHLALCTAEISHTDGQLESNSRAFTHLSPIGRGRRTRPRPGLIPRARGTNCPGFPSPEPWHAGIRLRPRAGSEGGETTEGVVGYRPLRISRAARAMRRARFSHRRRSSCTARSGCCTPRPPRTTRSSAYARLRRRARSRPSPSAYPSNPGAATAGETSHPSPLRRLRDRCAVGASRPVRDRILFTQRREGAAGRRHGLHPG
jgi:hypothetical protein